MPSVTHIHKKNVVNALSFSNIYCRVVFYINSDGPLSLPMNEPKCSLRYVYDVNDIKKT